MTDNFKRKFTYKQAACCNAQLAAELFKSKMTYKLSKLR